MTETLTPARELERPHAPGEVVEQRAASLVGLKFRDASETNDGTMTLTGHAAVFDQLSLPLYDWMYGEYQERIARGAFESVLLRAPDVHLVVAHDMRLVLARTTSRTLDLREDPAGLRVFASVDPGITFANDLALQMRRGDVDQMSFAFTVADEQWLIENEGTAEQRVTRTILQIGELYDVSVVAQGAYAQTDASLRQLLENATARGRVSLRARALPRQARATSLDQPDPEDAGETFATDLAEAIEALSDLVADGYDLSMPADTTAGTTVGDEVNELIGYLSDVLAGGDAPAAPTVDALAAARQRRLAASRRRVSLARAAVR